MALAEPPFIRASSCTCSRFRRGSSRGGGSSSGIVSGCRRGIFIVQASPPTHVSARSRRLARLCTCGRRGWLFALEEIPQMTVDTLHLRNALWWVVVQFNDILDGCIDTVML